MGRNSIVYSTNTSEIVGFNVKRVETTKNNKTLITATNVTNPANAAFPDGICHFTLDPVPTAGAFLAAFTAIDLAIVSVFTPSPPPSTPPPPAPCVLDPWNLPTKYGEALTYGEIFPGTYDNTTGECVRQAL